MDFSRYRHFLATPGVPRLFVSMLVGRLPAGMVSLAIVLRVTDAGGSYARAGLVTAANAVGMGLTAPVVSRLVDRYGQTVVLVPCAFATLASTIFFATLSAGSPGWLLMLAGGLIGAAIPPLSSTSRTMWPSVVTEARVLESAYAADATFQELIFIIGPLLVVAVAAPFGTAAAIVTTGVVACAGTLVFATSPASLRWRAATHDGQRHGALRSAGIRVLTLAMFALVVGFSAIEVSLIATARHGHAAASSGSSGSAGSGVLLATWAIGSMTAGLIYGSRNWRGTVAGRVVVLLFITAGLTAAMAVVHNVVLVGVIVALSGAGGAPALSGIYMTVQKIALPGVVTESYAWLGVGTLIGAAIGAAVGGAFITAQGPSAGFAFAAVAVFCAATTIGAGRRILERPGPHPQGRSGSELALPVGG